jgi:hypothetical protein
VWVAKEYLFLKKRPRFLYPENVHMREYFVTVYYLLFPNHTDCKSNEAAAPLHAALAVERRLSLWLHIN